MDEFSEITKVTLCPTGQHPPQDRCPKEREKMKKERRKREKIMNKERKTERRKERERKTERPSFHLTFNHSRKAGGAID